MTLDEVARRFQAVAPALEFVERRVKEDLRGWFDADGFAVISRIKTVESVAEKIESGRIASWSAIDDLVAFSVIVPSLADEPKVLTRLQESYIARKTKMRGAANKSPDAFRFDSTRFIGTLRPVGPADAKDAPYQVQFEVQIRTAFEHAWSVSTHSATYKPSVVDWRRLRLAAQLKASVEQLDALVLSFDSFSDSLEVSTWPDVDARSRVVEFVARLGDTKAISGRSMPESLGRLADNFVEALRVARNVRGFGKIVHEVSKALLKIQEYVEEGNVCPPSLSATQWMLLVLLETGYISSFPATYVAPFVDSDFSHFDRAARPEIVFRWDA